ncbi:YoaK family protein [Streptomyces sp. NPDC006527]|uniref:YoaK family protein n=1 Tax=Streptomyces sp. NPDC006527 TaxID=3364749 RepID=UPI0036CE1688
MPVTTEPETTSAPEAGGLPLVAVLLALTGVSGLIDAVCFLGLDHVFTANMTGNVLVLGFAAAGTAGFSVPHTLTSVAFFLVGALAGGRLFARMARTSRRTWTRVSLAVEAALLAAASALAFVAPDADGTTYALIAVTAVAMGLRNETVRKLRVAGLPTTTVITSLLTGLVADSPWGDGSGSRLPRRAAAILALFAGALVGAWLVDHHGLGVPLLVAAVASAGPAVTASGRD